MGPVVPLATRLGPFCLRVFGNIGDGMAVRGTIWPVAVLLLSACGDPSGAGSFDAGAADATVCLPAADSAEPVALFLPSRSRVVPIAVHEDTLAFAVLQASEQTDAYIYTVPAGGGCPTLVTTDTVNPVSIAIDATHVYWATSCCIKKQPLVGGTRFPIRLIDRPASAIRLVGDSLYYASGADLMRIAKDGGEPELVTTAADTIHHLVVHDQHLYMTDSDSVVRLPLVGGPLETLITNLQGLARIAVDDTNVYVTERNGYVGYSPLAGGASVELIPRDTLSSTRAHEVVVYNQEVYWSDSGVLHAHVPSPSPEQISTTTARSMVHDDNWLYWSNYGLDENDSPTGGTIYRWRLR